MRPSKCSSSRCANGEPYSCFEMLHFDDLNSQKPSPFKNIARVSTASASCRNDCSLTPRSLPFCNEPTSAIASFPAQHPVQAAAAPYSRGYTSHKKIKSVPSELQETILAALGRPGPRPFAHSSSPHPSIRRQPNQNRGAVLPNGYNVNVTAMCGGSSTVHPSILITR